MKRGIILERSYKSGTRESFESLCMFASAGTFEMSCYMSEWSRKLHSILSSKSK